MRLIYGLIAIGVGVAGLTLWSNSFQAERIEKEIYENAQDVIKNSQHDVQTKVEGRDITISGIADNQQEYDSFINGLQAVPGERVIRDELIILPLVDPYTFKGNWQGGAYSGFEGYIPNEGTRANFIEKGLDVGILPLGSGASSNWPRYVVETANAVQHLEEGRFEVDNDKILIKGLAKTPHEFAALKERLTQSLPENNVAYDITFLDDGTPPAFQLKFNKAKGIDIEGKLPEGIDLTKILGVETLTGQYQNGLLGDPHNISAFLATLRNWGKEIDAYDLFVEGENKKVVIYIPNGVDRALLTEEIRASLGQDVELDFKSSLVPENGSERNNLITGQKEIAFGGFWQPVFDFNVDQESCAEKTKNFLETNKINFVTGSAEFDAKSIRRINIISGILRRCVNDTDLSAEIGGHTDSQGSEEINQPLSEARAQAVFDALVQRGILADKLSATGYGSSQPIADNNTKEGRAANRRTEIIWSTIVR